MTEQSPWRGGWSFHEGAAFEQAFHRLSTNGDLGNGEQFEGQSK